MPLEGQRSCVCSTVTWLMFLVPGAGQGVVLAGTELQLRKGNTF